MGVSAACFCQFWRAPTALRAVAAAAGVRVERLLDARSKPAARRAALCVRPCGNGSNG